MAVRPPTSRPRPGKGPGWMLAGWLLLAAVGVAPAAGEDLQSVPVSRGTLFLPPGGALADAGDRVDLVVHFHGHPPLVAENFRRAGRPGALVVLNERGLSAAYAAPYRDPLAFEALLAEVRTVVGARRQREVSEGRLVVSSFSAGYGAVRELLAQPVAGRITDLVLADSLYAGYVEAAGVRRPDPAQMAGFERWAARAARGEVGMVVTVSELVPGAYASTAETAEVLRAAAGVDWERVPEIGPDGRWCLAAAGRAGLRMRLLMGATGDAHMEHLRRISAAWRLLP